LFDAETRAYYALEDLWGHAKRIPLGTEVPGTAVRKPTPK
jgi:hypothetical protein